MHIDWEDHELLTLQKGGNKSFVEFMSAYDLEKTESRKKYTSNAAHYYRKMLKGYIDGHPIEELPPVKNVGAAWNSDCDEIPSPIKMDNTSLDLSCISDKENCRRSQWNNSVCLNKSYNNVSRYSINIEAQNDLNQITILLNDPNKKKEEQRELPTAAMWESEEDEMMDINDDDMISDKDKYSIWYEASHKHINFKQLPDVRDSRSEPIDQFDCRIEGNRAIPSWWYGSLDENRNVRDDTMEIISRATHSIKTHGISFSKFWYSKTKEGVTKLMQSETMGNFKTKIRQFVSPEQQRTERHAYPTFADEPTASTIAPGRRQSMNYYNKRITPFEYE